MNILSSPVRLRARPFAVLVGAIAVAGSAQAGAWVMSTDSAYLRAFATYMSTTERYDFTGSLVPIEGNQTFSETSAALYFATGLDRNIEFNAATTLKQSELSDVGADSVTTGLGDLWMAAKFGLGTDIVVRSMELRIKIPTLYDEAGVPPLGDGQVDVEVRALWGLSLWTILRAYMGVEVGYRFRTGDPGDMVVMLGEFGGIFYKDLGYRFKIDGQYSLDIPKTNEDATELFAFNTRSTKLEAILWIGIGPGLFIEAGGVKLLDARNFTGGDSYGVAFTRQWDFGGGGR